MSSGSNGEFWTGDIDEREVDDEGLVCSGSSGGFWIGEIDEEETK